MERENAMDMEASSFNSPLEGFMTREDYESVLNEMRLTNGLPWTLPITLPTNYEGKSNQQSKHS